MMFFVKCFDVAQTLYACYVTTWEEAFAMAHLLAEVYESRVNVYRPDENVHCYAVSSNLDVTARYFT